MEISLKLTGILCGVLARMLMPYLRKLKQGKIDKFQKKYLTIALSSFIIALITTLLIFPKFNIDVIKDGVEASVKLFCLSFGFGFAWNSLISETTKWKEKKN